MASSAGTFEQLITLMTSSSNSPITITADIDAKSEGFLEPVSQNSSCEIDLNGHTISNAFFSGAGICNGKTISNGNLINIYYGSGGPALYKVVASLYCSGTPLFRKLERSAMDLTCNPTVLFVPTGSGQSTLSNIVIRDAHINNSSTSYGGFSQYRWTGVVLHNCVIGNNNQQYGCRLGISHPKNYLCIDSTCTYLGDLLVSVNAQSLFCGYATEANGRDVIVSESVLRSESELKKRGFLP